MMWRVFREVDGSWWVVRDNFLLRVLEIDSFHEWWDFATMRANEANWLLREGVDSYAERN